VLTILRRRGWILVITPLVVTVTAEAAYVFGSDQQRTYSAEAVAVVATSSRLSPDQANRLAVTYARLIPADTAVMGAVARSLGTTVPDVSGRISVFNDPQTALLRINYRGTSATNSIAGTKAVMDAIKGSRPVSPNIAPRSVSIVRIPNRASASRDLGNVVLISLVLGSALGALLLVAWERTDPRVDSLADLSSEVPCPISSADDLSDAAATALLDRWRELGGGSRIHIAMLPVNTQSEAVVPNLARRLAHGDTAEQTIVSSNIAPASPSGAVRKNASRTRSGPTMLVVGGVPGSGSAGQGVALASELTVLVAQKGTRRKDVRRALRVLREFGVAPAWAILASRSSLGDVRRVRSRVAESHVAAS
jgi:hypothetical protein